MVRFKPLTWIIVISIFVVFTSGFIFLITRIIYDWSWLFFFGWLIFMVVCGLFIGAIIIALKWKRKQPPKIRLDPKSAKQKAINECKNDEDNPDNFIVKNWVIKRVGQEGLPRTPILWLTGVGSELKEKIDAIVNLDNPKGEIGWMRDKTDIEVKEAIRLMAENPESEITEQTVTGFDPYGRPQSTTTTKKVSQREKEEADKKAEAELANTL